MSTTAKNLSAYTHCLNSKNNFSYVNVLCVTHPLMYRSHQEDRLVMNKITPHTSIVCYFTVSNDCSTIDIREVNSIISTKHDFNIL